MTSDLLTPPIAAAASRTPWGRRWVREVGGPADLASATAKRARDIVRESRATALEVAPGYIRIRVRAHGGPRMHTVEIEQWTDEQYQAAVDVFASSVRRLGELASSRVSDETFDILVERDAGLTKPALDKSASEEDIAALLLAASALDREPLWMFRMRQPNDDEFLDAVRERRAPTTGDDDDEDPLAGQDVREDPFAAGDLASIALHPKAPHRPTGFLEGLGELPIDADPEPLHTLVTDAATFAWQIAAGEGSDAADDTVLLAELRALRFATPRQLADVLGRDEAEIRERLDELYAEKIVLRTGTGEKTKYRAVDGN